MNPNSANSGLTAPGLHVAVPGHQETSAIRISFEANEDIDRDLICSRSNKMRTAYMPWTDMHGPHMNGLRRRASSDKNVIFLGVAVREPRIETASQQFVPHQSRAPGLPEGATCASFWLALNSRKRTGISCGNPAFIGLVQKLGRVSRRSLGGFQPPCAARGVASRNAFPAARRSSADMYPPGEPAASVRRLMFRVSSCACLRPLPMRFPRDFRRSRHAIKEVG